MFLDLGITPVSTLLVAFLVFAILSDFLLEIFSVRMSLSTGRIQSWLFDHIGQNLFTDFLISIGFQFFSFRKKAFFTQVASLANVGSFNNRQILIISLGSFIGIGASIIMLAGGSVYGGILLCAISFLLSILSKDQLKDLGVAFLGLGLFVVALQFFNQYLSSSMAGIQNFDISEGLALGLIVFSTLMFRTPVAFLLTLGMLHFFVGLNIYWLPGFFLIHSLLGCARFYLPIVRNLKRLRVFAFVVFWLQISQWAISQSAVYFFERTFAWSFYPESFLDSYKIIVLAYFGYMSLSLLVVVPLVFAKSYLPFFNKPEEKKSGSQKILVDSQRGSNFSIHLSLFLLRQEFIKFTTTVHTLFKISRETDYDQEEINQRFVRYRGMLERVGDELKELCFHIGKQRSYRWQVKEIMSYYRYVNQLELLMDDLAFVNGLLREKGQDEEWERECRFWLGLQLKMFESFFNFSLGVGKDEPEKVKANIEKSYNILDRFFQDEKNRERAKNSTKTFYRITESIANLAL